MWLIGQKIIKPKSSDSGHQKLQNELNFVKFGLLETDLTLSVENFLLYHIMNLNFIMNFTSNKIGLNFYLLF